MYQLNDTLRSLLWRCVHVPTAYLSDPVWASLDPGAGLSKQNRRRWLAGTAGLGLLAIAAAALYWSGLPVPRLSSRQRYGYSTDGAARTFSYRVVLHNDGWAAVAVRDVGQDGPGLRLVSVGGGDRDSVRATIGPGGEVELELVYEVTDCHAVRSDRWAIPVQVERPWGWQTVRVQQPLVTGTNAPAGLRSFSGEDPYGQSWQQMLADLACEALPR